MLAEHSIRISQEAIAAEKSVRVSIDLLEHLFASYPYHDFQVRFWEGSIWGRANKCRFVLVLKHPGALRNMFLSPSELTLGESYIFNDFDIEGDIEASVAVADFLLSQEQALSKKLYLTTILGRLPATGRPRAVRRQLGLRGAVHSRHRDQQAISYHYDLPPEFYSLFLDPRMVYSCAYFRTAEDGLDEAQEQKLDYICRKLRLCPEERLLDVGCGWGALIIHAAAHYGVKSLGITLSTVQAEFARQQIREAGLDDDRCRVELCDYRQLKTKAQFDKIASVGMFEHVGEDLLPEYFSRIYDLLRPEGVFLNHGIAYSATHHRHGPSFTDRYVFPDGELVPINTTLRTAEFSALEVRDMESLREHYVMTLHRWLERLERHADNARRLTDDTTYRIWRLYMAGSAHAFRTGRLNLYQTMLVKPESGRCALPLTREDWYCKQAGY
jgi:cyclopropane-fatty-acyl-phospholipid synthase